MMPENTWTQDRHLLAIETPLGKDKLLLTSLAGEEAISELFAYDVGMLSTDRAIAAESLVGQQVKLTISMETGTSRTLHAMVARWRAGPLITRELRQYRAELVPWLWFLGQTSDCLIFQNLSVPEIVERVFNNFGFSDYQLSLSSGDYPKLEYCVQYRETALNFVSRLMEEAGIFYFFRHDENKHVMVIADKNVAFKAFPDQKLVYGPETRRGHVTAWEHSYEFRPGRWTQRDYNFETPSTDLTTNEKTLLKFSRSAGFERFDYPGRYRQKGIGTTIARKLMQAEEANHHWIAGASNYNTLDVGRCITLSDHPSESDSQAYVVRRVRHEATDNSYLSSEDTTPPRYDNSFEAMPFDRPFRPECVTEIPFVHGLQTAVVTGPAGEEIYTDKYGRIKVQFHWDRQGKKDERSSCFVRVAQSWAGRNFGAIFLPRIGQEVVVAFEEGNPDRPLVVGSVYNAEQPVPFDLPGNKTQSGLRTRSSLGGGAANCNELIFEDRKGSELVKLHAEKDLTTEVENDASHWVGHDETTVVDRNRKETVHGTETITIDGNRTETVHSNEIITIDKNRTETVSQNETITILLNRVTTIGVTDSLTVGAARMHTVGGAEAITVGAARSVSVGGPQSVTVGGSETTSVGKNRSTSVGDNESLKVGKKISIDAGDEIVLKTGNAQITMKKNGDITIKGKAITIEGSGNVVVKGQKILQN